LARYRVILTPAAQRQLGKLRGPEFAAMRGVILALADDPRPAGATKLSGSRDLFRVQVRVDGRPWRVVFQLRTKSREVVVTRVAARNERTYRGMRSGI